MENLWPAFEKKEIVTPKSIFETQVEFFNLLGTGLRAHLSNSLSGDKLVSIFRIQASSINGFTFNLFKATNLATAIYPVTLHDYITEANFECADKEELEANLKRIFNSQELIDVIQNLLAQIGDSISEF